MEELDSCLAELRYLYKYIRFADRANYVKYGSKTLFSCLVKVGLNLMYANKNGLSLSPKQIKTLKKVSFKLNKFCSCRKKQRQQANYVSMQKVCVNSNLEHFNQPTLSSFFLSWYQSS